MPPALSAYLSEMCDISGGGVPLFRLGRTPVTVAVWREFGALPEPPLWGWIDDHPMVRVSWDDAQAFCALASEVSGVALSLPTEAQWEYAARGGRDGKAYPWGGAFDSSKLWCDNLVDEGTASVARTVRRYENGYGLRDMSGNVWEWTADWFEAGSGEGCTRVTRGGSWGDVDPLFFRCDFRGREEPAWRDDFLGFRLHAGPL